MLGDQVSRQVAEHLLQLSGTFGWVIGTPCEVCNLDERRFIDPPAKSTAATSKLLATAERLVAIELVGTVRERAPIGCAKTDRVNAHATVSCLLGCLQWQRT